MDTHSITRLCFSAIVLLLHSFVACLAMTVINITTDQHALLALKSHISDPKHMLMDNWTAAAPVCDWIGVTCGSRHHRITTLDISNMGLTGSIPPHLGNLSFLVSLDVSNNSFNGNLPEELGHLRRLKHLNLSFNIFSGGLPACFAVLSNLQNLLLRKNKFTGSIRPSISNISKLELLDLGFNSLQGKIPHEIGNLRNMKKLGMAANQLTGPLPFTIFNISSLQILVFSQNSLSGVLPMEICYRLPELEELHLVHNQFQGQIPASLHECSKLQILSMAFNNFGGPIPKGIGNLTMLREVYLGDNNLTGEIPKEIANLGKLEVLGLAANNLEGVIPLRIFNISSLRYIMLSYNHFLGKLPLNIGHSLPNLEGLYLGVNNLSGPIPESISNASNLIVLNLSWNKFTGSIPSLLGNLKFLALLYLNSNNFVSKSSSELNFLTSLTNCQYMRELSFGSNPLNGILPTSIGNLSMSLWRFHACCSKIKGNIPQEIGNLSNLAFVALFGNDFSGTIPATIKGLEKVQELYLFDNNLRGSIPIELCNLRNLGALYIGQNQISGTMPACLGNITSLRYLHLNSNKLTSIIPSSLGGLKDLLELNLSSNYLSGPLPQEVGSLKVAVLVNLSVNELSGNIPSTIGGLQELIYLSLCNNRLQGPIPKSFEKLVSLEFLDLSQNNISDTIPKSLEALRHLKYFNVSFNKLRGEIPSGGPFANFTSQSFISNERLCGSPRFQVQPCQTNAIHHAISKKLLRGFYVLPAIALLVMLFVTFAFVFIRYRRIRNIPMQTHSLPTVTIHERVSYQELQQATEGFSESNLLGMGSFGTVYKGTFKDGKLLAIKVFNLQVDGAFRSFDIECEVLRELRHRNLTKVISSCSNLDFKALVLEYMHNGSLEKWLYSHNYFLDFLQRIDIMIDVACALDHLHHGCTTPVVHCDLKPSNILLDAHLVGRVSDFGIAKLLGKGESIKETITLATFGYMAPEYGQNGLVSTMCDVYSYGIILMEIFTRIKPTDDMFDGDFTLKRWVKDSLYNTETSIIDVNLLRPEDNNVVEKIQCVSSIMELALNCSAETPEERINMNDVLAALKKIKQQFTQNFIELK